jgi:hypothetical protein
MKKKKVLVLVIAVLAVLTLVLGYSLYQKQKAYKVSTENNYNMAFYELVDYVQNVKTYLAKYFRKPLDFQRLEEYTGSCFDKDAYLFKT